MVILIMVGAILIIMVTDGTILTMGMVILITVMDILITVMDIITIITLIIQDEEALHTLMEPITTIDILKTQLPHEVALTTTKEPLQTQIVQLETALPL